MIRGAMLIALSFLPSLAGARAPPARPAEATGGMVITGDREAPLVLHIVPWQEPKPVAPPRAPLQELLPAVVDRPQGVLDDPANRPLGASEPARR